MIRLLQRLDKETSGVLLVSRTHRAHVAMQRMLATPAARKEYLAVVHGRPRPRSGRITLALGRDPFDRRRVMAAADGRPSETRYDVLETNAGLSLVRCELVTGRTHQIRVHLAASGWPIAGDTVYGRPHPLAPRQALHAWRVTFPHPESGTRVTIVAPVPDDLAAAFALFGAFDPGEAGLAPTR
jgi:23S rRNA pseudouridine1911/1915/1917 synthase